MKKRLFQVLDEMNVNDDVNKTALVGCCYDMVEAKTAKGGGHVTMGVPAEAITRIFVGECQPFLILLDKKEYHRLKDQPVDSAEASVKARGEIITQLNNQLTNAETALRESESKAARYEKALKNIADRPTTAEFEISKNDGAIAYNAIIEEAREALTPKQATDEQPKQTDY